jgi:hypothetical protein
MTYGGALPSLTASYDGLVNGDTPALLTKPATIATVATSSRAGTYDITATGATDPDYSITYAAGSLSITPAALVITADNQSMNYGGVRPTLTASYRGFTNGDTAALLSMPPTLTTVPASSHVGKYDIAVSGAVDPDYTISYVTGSLSVTPVALRITADNKSMVYGALLPPLTASYSGLVNGDSPASLLTPPSLSTVPASSHVGIYDIMAQGASDPDYNISYRKGSLTIVPAALLITADSAHMTYGGKLPTLTASYTGLVNGDSPASLTTPPTLATVPASRHVGSYQITAAGAMDPDYEITAVPAHLTILPASLVIAADDLTKVYGLPLPPLTAQYHGLVNGDTLAALRGTAYVDTTATAATGVGTSRITVGPGTIHDADYVLTFVPGTLTITPARLSASGVAVSVAVGAPFDGPVATFTNVDPFRTASAYTAAINWGDGTISQGAISGASGSLTVNGTHTYLNPLHGAVSVQIAHTLGDTTSVTTSATVLVTNLGFGMARDAAYWAGAAGQALINGFNGGPTSTSLSRWLATSYPGLFGSHAGLGDLAGETNAQVAALMLNTGRGEAYQQMLATALNIYATTGSLGGPAGEAAGFHVTFGGLGASGYDVSNAGVAFGVAKNTTVSVSGLLTALNDSRMKGTLRLGAPLFRRAVRWTLQGINQRSQSGTPTGQTAGVRFWSSNRGQTLLTSFNGGANSTRLSTWLATNFSRLYGASAGSHNLSGKTNADVATYLRGLRTRTRPSADQQALVTALDVYATTASLGGAHGAAAGFRISDAGLGAVAFNVRRAGSAFGVPNNTTLSVYQLLSRVNQTAVQGVVANGNVLVQDQIRNTFLRLNADER